MRREVMVAQLWVSLTMREVMVAQLWVSLTMREGAVGGYGGPAVGEPHHEEGGYGGPAVGEPHHEEGGYGGGPAVGEFTMRREVMVAQLWVSSP